MFSLSERVAKMNGFFFQKYGKYHKMGILCIVKLYGVLLRMK
jgi:hypothetical protein